jgi:type II secretory pathway pseudopilin PulG
MMFRKIQGNAFSLIEMVIAIGVFLVIGSGITYLATGSYTAFTGTGDTQGKARFAEDAMQAIAIIRDRSWGQLEANDGGDSYDSSTALRIDKNSGGDWVITADSNGETRNGFTRKIYISAVQRDSNGAIVTSGGTNDLSTKKIKVVISVSGQADYTFETYVSNSNSVRMEQTSWNGATSTSVWDEGSMDWETQSAVDVPSSTGRLQLTTTTI